MQINGGLFYILSGGYSKGQVSRPSGSFSTRPFSFTLGIARNRVSTCANVISRKRFIAPVKLSILGEIVSTISRELQ